MSVFLSKMVRIIIYSLKQKQIVCCYSDTTNTGVDRNLEQLRNENDEGCNKEEAKPNNGENNNVNENKPALSGFKRTKTKHHK